MRPVDLFVQRLRQAGCDPIPVGNGWQSTCPVHRGNRRNLSVAEGDSTGVIFNCHHVDSSGRGCDREAILAAIGLTFADICGDGTKKTVNPKPVAKAKKQHATLLDACRAASWGIEQTTGLGTRKFKHWEYPPCDGMPWWIVRFDLSDGSKQYRPVTKGKLGYFLGDPAKKNLPLYLSNEIAPTGPVYVVEGEKACDAAWLLGLNAVSPAHGAGSPARSDWGPLRGRDVVIWPDNDDSGQGFARLVSDALKDLFPAPTVAILSPADLGLVKKGDDAADYYESRKDDPDPLAALKTALAKAKTVEIPKPETPLALQFTRTGDPRPNLYNAAQLIERDEEFKSCWKDTFFGKIFLRKNVELDKYSLAELTYRFQRDHIPTLGMDTTYDAIGLVANRRAINSIAAWLDELKWDGVPRINKFFSQNYGVEASTYAADVSRNFWMSLVARIRNPGCKHDYMVVLESGQGIGKTRSLSAIVGPELYLDLATSVDSKDFYLAIRGKLIVEVGELDCFRKAEVTRIKQILSCQVDRYRAPYERLVEDIPRTAIFVGTTNKSDWNRDETGARRFWPLVCSGEVDVARIEAERLQLFAEADVLFKQGIPFYLVDKAEAEAIQEERLVRDPWQEPIVKHIANLYEITAEEILTSVIKLESARQQRKDVMRVGDILARLGWKCLRARRDGIRTRYWVRGDNQPLAPIQDLPVF